MLYTAPAGQDPWSLRYACSSDPEKVIDDSRRLFESRSFRLPVSRLSFAWCRRHGSFWNSRIASGPITWERTASRLETGPLISSVSDSWRFQTVLRFSACNPATDLRRQG